MRVGIRHRFLGPCSGRRDPTTLLPEESGNSFPKGEFLVEGGKDQNLGSQKTAYVHNAYPSFRDTGESCLIQQPLLPHFYSYRQQVKSPVTS